MCEKNDFFKTLSLAKYHPRLVEKPYGNSQKHSSAFGPRFLSQNVEYVGFIDRAPHMHLRLSHTECFLHSRLERLQVPSHEDPILAQRLTLKYTSDSK